jgi:hypothetical protein
MEKFFLYYIDLVILAMAITFTAVFTGIFSKRSVLPVRKLPLFFLLFGATTVASSMCGHLGEISYRAIVGVIAGTFKYDYKFYSLNLMGIVFLAISIYMLLQVKEWIMGDLKAKNSFVKAALVLIILSAPTFPLTPIGLLPTLACMISFAALPFTINVTKRRWQQV